MLNLFAGADDDTDSCTIQSTPCYTDSSVEHLIRLPANVPEREDRVLVVILLSITFFVQVREIQYAMSLSYIIIQRCIYDRKSIQKIYSFVKSR